MTERNATVESVRLARPERSRATRRVVAAGTNARAGMTLGRC